MIIGPELILTLDDTLLMLKLGEHAAFVLITLHTLIMVFVYPQYGHRPMPYATWSLVPLLLASAMRCVIITRCMSEIRKRPRTD